MPGEEDQEDPENTDDTEELRRVDREIEYKVIGGFDSV